MAEVTIKTQKVIEIAAVVDVTNLLDSEGNPPVDIEEKINAKFILEQQMLPEVVQAFKLIDKFYKSKAYKPTYDCISRTFSQGFITSRDGERTWQVNVVARFVFQEK